MKITTYLFAAAPILLCGCLDGGDRVSQCETARRTVAGGSIVSVNYGFFTDFNPVSYAVTQDPGDAAFDQPLGYEPSLIAAVETFSRGRLTFNSLGIGNPFAGIWLRAADGMYDVIGGGIAPLAERTLNANSRQVIRFGAGHITFQQALLVNFDSTIERHGDLNSGHTVGALSGTTGESRLLELTGITDAEGYLRAGTLVVLADGGMLTAGEPGGPDALRITPAGSSDAIAARVQLMPTNVNQPAVRYYSSEPEAVQALRDRDIDAVAGVSTSSLLVAQENPDELRVTAFDTTAVEQGAFSYAATPAGDELRDKVDAVILCLTDDGAIDFPQWFEDMTVFARRAETLR